YAPTPETLRAPDIAVGNVPNAPDWVQGAPPLAVEYADTGQDEKELAVKISELLAAGTQIVGSSAFLDLGGSRSIRADRSCGS
ncbi:MAG TPA: hypothetical protein VN851_19935, partial [Thermoanaerobaculia bacterium]|nr:hypothetical protein [Thermoanaerobaculia bacterium]